MRSRAEESPASLVVVANSYSPQGNAGPAIEDERCDGRGRGSLSESILEGFYRVKGRQCEGEAMSARELNHHDDVSNWRVKGKNTLLSTLPSTSSFLIPSQLAITSRD